MKWRTLSQCPQNGAGREGVARFCPRSLRKRAGKTRSYFFHSEKLKKAVAVSEEKIQERSPGNFSSKEFRTATAFSSFLVHWNHREILTQNRRILRKMSGQILGPLILLPCILLPRLPFALSLLPRIPLAMPSLCLSAIQLSSTHPSSTHPSSTLPFSTHFPSPGPILHMLIENCRKYASEILHWRWGRTTPKVVGRGAGAGDGWGRFLFWPWGSTGVERCGCIPRSVANNLGEIPQKWELQMPYFEQFFFSSGEGPECTKIARFSAVAAAIFTAPPQNRAIFKAPTCAISPAKKIASERRFSLRLKGTNLIPTAEFPAIPESPAKIASERRCAILVHSGRDTLRLVLAGLSAILHLYEQRHFYANKAKTFRRHFCLKHYKTRCTPEKRDRIRNPGHGQHPERDQNEIGTRYEFA